jgi:hypothetical protein
MAVHVATTPSGLARDLPWDAVVGARPELATHTLRPPYRVAATAVALLALVTAALPVLLAVALLVDPGGFARAFS